MRRVLQHRNIMNGVSLSSIACAVLVKPEVMSQKNLSQAAFDVDQLGVPPELMANIDETSLLLDPGDNVAPLSSEEAAKMLNKCNLSVSIRVKAEEEEKDASTSKKRSIQVFAITTPKPELKAIICQIYDRNVTEVKRYKVLLQIMIASSTTHSYTQ